MQNAQKVAHKPNHEQMSRVYRKCTIFHIRNLVDDAVIPSS